jgi:hypothetical protein
MISRQGFVYFYKHNNLSPIKIGHSKSKNPFFRTNHASTYSPFGVVHIGHIQSDDCQLLESKLHSKFKHKRLNGEWFDIEEIDVLNIIKSYTNGTFFYKEQIESDLNDLFISFLNENKNRKIYNKDLLINYNRFNENKIYIKTLLIIISNNGYKIKKDRDSKGRYLIIKDIITNGIK